MFKFRYRPLGGCQAALPHDVSDVLQHFCRQTGLLLSLHFLLLTLNLSTSKYQIALSHTMSSLTKKMKKTIKLLT